MDRYAYYVCFKCGKAYFEGEARCDLDARAGDTFNPEELVCGGCSDVSQVRELHEIIANKILKYFQAQMCPKRAGIAALWRSSSGLEPPTLVIGRWDAC